MNELLVVVEFSDGLPEAWTPDLVGEVGGLGRSLWTALDDGSALGLLHFADGPSADEHLRTRMEALPEGDSPAVIPSTVRHLSLQGGHGMRLEATHIGGYLTIVHRLAPPGYGVEAVVAVAEAMESIEPLEGYAGHLRGVNVALPDEVWAVVFWSAPPVLPPLTLEEDLSVAHYRRVR